MPVMPHLLPMMKATAITTADTTAWRIPKRVRPKTGTI